MKAYRVSTNLKLGLIGFAVVIAVASLWYTDSLVDRLREREHSMVELWVNALEQIPKAEQAAQEETGTRNREALYRLDSLLSDSRLPSLFPSEDVGSIRRAVVWAQGISPVTDLTFITEDFLQNNVFEVPAIVYNETYGQFISWLNINVDHESFDSLSTEQREDLQSALDRYRDRFDRVHPPLRFEVDLASSATIDAPESLVMTVHYGESALVTALRWFPYVQLLFVALFVVVGYLGFSYVRRSEQSSLWVGMAREAAHQLGTPISSLMGWLEYLRMQQEVSGARSSANEEIYREVEEDINRLRRVASRFSDIGSMPKLESQPLAPVLESVTEYIRRRIPQSGTFVRLQLSVDSALHAPLNSELFEWVIENLLKNALDAIDTERGRIDVIATAVDSRVRIDVSDTGKGIDRRQWKNVFRPGYSTKKRGWGLGLSLAKRIVEDYHGGSLTLLQSRPGHGSTFRIEIPLTGEMKSVV